MFDWQKFLDDVARVSDGDYASGFKMLGFVLYVAQFGAEKLLSGTLVSPRTYYRWLEIIKAAGWGSLLSQARFEQALQEYIAGFPGQPEDVRSAMLQALDRMLSA